MMQVEYHKWWSPNLGHDMELKTYGHAGKPVVVFPSSGGRFYEYEDFGMIEVCRTFIESGQIRVIAVDSVDNQSWLNYGAHPADRARRHQDFDRYFMEEVVPFIRHTGGQGKFLATGCSMGGYHSTNFFFRHPDVFDTLISLSGVFSMHWFIGDYMDENVYFNTPAAYLKNLHDPWYIDQYRQSQIVIAVGQGSWEDDMLADTAVLRHVLEEKQIPHWIDIWGHDVNHDWVWWRRMMPHLLGQVSLNGCAA